MAGRHCLLTRQEDGGQALQKERRVNFGLGDWYSSRQGKNEELVEKQAVPIIQAERLNFWIDGDKRGFLGFLYMDISICVYTYGVLQETWFENGFFIALV
jgi:hypothetical protein